MKKMMAALLIACCLALSLPVCGAQPGTTGTVFNKRFMPSIKPSMTYEQLVKIVGTPGAQLGQEKRGQSTIARYRWNGGKDSKLEVRVSNGKIVDASMKAPNGHTYRIDGAGKVTDLGS
jgi:hypothetical protein